MSAETSHIEDSLVNAPELDECNHYVENVSPLFDPKRVLLRRTFFINEDYSKYISVGYCRARDYQPLVEFGAHNKRPLLLPQHLPRLCDAVCR
jgi:hypothetical protein